MTDASELAPASDERTADERVAELVEAVNTQVLPQLAHLSHGPLAMGVLEVLRAAVTSGETKVGVVLGARVMVDGHLYNVAVQVVAGP